MARRKRVYRKIERRDPRYDSALVGKLISKVMLDGKRSLAERIVYAAIDMANEGTDSIDPLEVITRAIENAKPRGSEYYGRCATYQVPGSGIACSESSQVRWIVNYARKSGRRDTALKATNQGSRQQPGFLRPQARRRSQDGRKQPHWSSLAGNPSAIVSQPPTFDLPQILLVITQSIT